MSYEECVGVSYQQLHEDPASAIADIVDRYQHVARRCDAVLIVGSDYTDVASPSELSMNARIAANLGAPVVLAVRAADRTPDEVVQVVQLCLAEITAKHAHTAAVVANRCAPADLDAVAEALRGIEADGLKCYVLPEEPLLVAPSVGELLAAVDGTLVSGDEDLMSREVLEVLAAGMTAEHVLERLREGMAVITPGDRSDVVLAVASAHAAVGFPSLSCIILNGGLPLHRSIVALVEGLGLRLPIVATDLGTYETARAVAQVRGRVTATSQRKIDTALELMDAHVDTADLIAQLSITMPAVVTPQMFTYQLLDRARSDLKRIVLPEGDDDRILRAAGRLLARSVAELTILGDETAVRARAAELGVDLSAAVVLNPQTSDLCDQFADQYAELRKHKGISVERAHETIRDVSYFGTMLVHNDMVDGMVSGARHTTAHTVRPSFEIIKTMPDVSTVSSIFLMCLADKVLAYGDCAIVPDPTSEQLADIAISSARTAAQFGIEPRVAMLSYSTGTSGTGADVEKVRAATELVRTREPSLLVEGPIQYDAADRAVGRGHQDAGFSRRRTGDGADLPGSEHRQQHLQGGPAQRGRDRHRPRASGAQQTGQRSVSWRARRGHRQHRGHHRDPSSGHVTARRGAHPMDPKPTVLVLNCGSSSLKYAVIEPDSGRLVIDGIVERIGEGPVPDHEAALRAAFDEFSRAGHDLAGLGLMAVGHRVVHGGPDLYQPAVVDDGLMETLTKVSPLAPLHNPPAMLGIEVARRVLPDLPHVAVFDTAFFHDLPQAAATYAIDRDVAEQWHIRRYGFHGTSHQYVSEQAAEFLDAPLASLNQIVLHLGNGASASAIVGGRPLDTSMGLTPMEGLVMGTRSGDVDPGILVYLWRNAGMSMEDIESMLNRRSGLLGLGGAIDFRVLHANIEAGDEDARLAYDVYIHRLRKYIGAYMALLGNTDVITFTAGVGENDATVRRDVLSGLAPLGIELDEHLNDSPARGPRRISFETAPTTVLVIPTDEELAIARACASAVD